VSVRAAPPGRNVAKSAPDGDALLHFSSAHALMPAFDKLPYDSVRDFVHGTPACRTVGDVLASHPSVPVKSGADLIALAKERPGQLDYGHSGHGAVLQAARAMLNTSADIRMTTVQYRGIGVMVDDLAGGHIDLAFLTSSSAIGLAKHGEIRARGISGARRWKRMPDVPTIAIAESGLNGFEYCAWSGFWFPASTPADIVGRANAEIAKSVAHPEVLQRFDEPGFDSYPMKPGEFRTLVQNDIVATHRLASEAGDQAARSLRCQRRGRHAPRCVDVQAFVAPRRRGD
jgi:tripartite-type tricarboxylate transporter receptor subunit TctC